MPGLADPRREAWLAAIALRSDDEPWRGWAQGKRAQIAD